MTRHLVILFAFMGSALAFADYGWVPDFKKLDVRAGLDLYQVDENFNSNGSTEALKVGSTTTELRETSFSLMGEYGIAEDWSMYLHFPFVSSNVNVASSGNSGLSSAGLGDIRAGIKWNVKPAAPILTINADIRFPSGKSTASSGEVVLGNGNFDLNLKLFTGHKSGVFVFALGPGLLLRSGGYSLGTTVEGAVQIQLTRGFIRAFGDFIYSFADEVLFDSSLKTHDARGTGGSYSKLNGSPIGLTAGGKIGARIYNEWWVDGGFAMGVVGNRYPAQRIITIGVRNTFDFFVPSNAKKTREVPFESDGTEPFYR